MSELKENKKKTVIAVAVLAVAAVIFGVIYVNFKPKPVAGAKKLTIEVVDDAGESETYTVQTDAEFLRQAIEDADGLVLEGTESEYGLMVETVNGLTADYTADGAYWAFYVDGTYCENGVDTQPVSDGQAYQIVYTTAE